MRRNTNDTAWKLLIAFTISLLATFSMLYLVAMGKMQAFSKLLDPSLLIGLFALLAGIAFSISYYEYHGIGPQEGITRRGPHQNIVSLTFDDGPSPTYTPQILDILEEKGVKASFFVVGQNVEKYPDIARRIVAEGHDIGNHTYSHRELVPSTKKIVENQLEKTDSAIQKTTGVRTKLFRPPRGMLSNAVRALVVAHGYRIILWTASSMDWSGVSPRTMAMRLRLFMRRGAIILFHDSGALIRNEGASRGNTVQALPMIIDHLRDKKGYEIVPVSEMLSRLGEDEIIQPEEALEQA